MNNRKELWQKAPSFFVKGGGHYKKRQVTKGELVRKFKEKGGIMSPKIGTEVRDSADDVKEGVPYLITNVEDLTTEVQQLSGIRVTLLSDKAKEGNVLLWKRPITGKGSKLGVFITQLGDNTDEWLDKWIIFKVWRERNRVLEVIEAPKVIAKKAPEKKAA